MGEMVNAVEQPVPTEVDDENEGGADMLEEVQSSVLSHFRDGGLFYINEKNDDYFVVLLRRTTHATLNINHIYADEIIVEYTADLPDNEVLYFVNEFVPPSSWNLSTTKSTIHIPSPRPLCTERGKMKFLKYPPKPDNVAEGDWRWMFLYLVLPYQTEEVDFVTALPFL